MGSPKIRGERLIPLLGIALCVAWLAAGFQPFDEACVIDECMYLGDVDSYVHSGKMHSSWHWVRAFLPMGMEHSGTHSNGYVLYGSILRRFLGFEVDALWRWNALTHLAAMLGLAWWCRRRLKEKVSATRILVLGFLLPTLWASVNLATQDHTILTLSVLSVWAWLAFLRRPDWIRFSVFAAANLAAVLLRELEAVRMVLGLAGAWYFGGRKRWVIALGAAWLAATAWSFSLLNSARQPLYLPTLDFVRDATSVSQLVAGVGDLVGVVWGVVVKNFLILFNRAAHLSVADMLMYPWMFGLLIVGAWLAARWRAATPSGWKREPCLQLLVVGLASTALIVAACFMMYETDDLRTVRMAQSSLLMVLLSLAGLRRPSGRSAIAVVLASGLALSCWIYSDRGAWGPARSAQGTIRRTTSQLLAVGAGAERGEPVIYYDFEQTRRWGIEHAMRLQFDLNQALRRRSGEPPFYHLVYVGFDLLSIATARDVLVRLKELGKCPVFAVLEGEDPGRLATLRSICGAYERVSSSPWVHWDWTGGTGFRWDWIAAIYRRVP